MTLIVAGVLRNGQISMVSDTLIAWDGPAPAELLSMTRRAEYATSWLSVSCCGRPIARPGRAILSSDV